MRLGNKRFRKHQDASLSVHDEQPPVSTQSVGTSASILESPIEPVIGKDETHEEPPQQAWNLPKANVWRTIMACYSLLILGASDAACGALIPYLETYYSLNYLTVSLVFVSPVAGYALSAITNNKIHMTFGQRGIAIGAPFIRIISYLILCLHPPWGVFILGFIIMGYGNGLIDAGWNAWVGHLLNANEVLGFLHGAYGLGGTLGPLISTTLVTKANLPWYTFYYILIGATSIELIGGGLAFWRSDGKLFRKQHPKTTSSKGSRTKEVATNRVVWTCAIYLFIYVGVEVSIGGWVVSFMMRVRDAEPFAAGMSATAFWLGLTIGRVVLGFITGRVGEKLAIIIYMATTVALHLIFYFVPSIPVSFVAVTLEGFFLGPLFPAAIVATTKILPSHLHVSGIGFATAIAAGGACLLPFAIGAIAQEKGVQVLMPIVLAFLVADAVVWSTLPSLKRAKKIEEASVEEGAVPRPIGEDKATIRPNNEREELRETE